MVTDGNAIISDVVRVAYKRAHDLPRSPDVAMLRYAVHELAAALVLPRLSPRVLEAICGNAGRKYLFRFPWLLRKRIAPDDHGDRGGQWGSGA
jgi:hypothetical protein